MRAVISRLPNPPPSTGPGLLANHAPLKGIFRTRRYEEGEAVFPQGASPSLVHILERGAVELGRRQRTRRVTVQVLAPGDVFGDVPFLTNSATSFEARTLRPSVVLSGSATAVASVLRDDPVTAARWLQSVADRMAGLQQRLLEVLAGEVEVRLARLLLDRGLPTGMNVTQQKLAEMLGAHRTTVNRALGQLESMGAVEVGYRHIMIRDPAVLEEVVASLMSAMGDGR